LRLCRIWSCTANLFFLALLVRADTVASSQSAGKQALTRVTGRSTERPVTIADAIRMTRLPGPDNLLEAVPQGHFAYFSPDGKKFLIVLKKGNVDQNVNEFSLLLIETKNAFDSPKPDLLVTMASASNRGAIRRVKWLSDNETITFLGERSDEDAQIYSFNIRKRRLKRLVSRLPPIRDYDITPDGKTVLLTVETPVETFRSDQKARREGVVIQGQGLDRLLAGDHSLSGKSQMYLQRHGETPFLVPAGEEYNIESGQLSPDGRYVILGVGIREVPASWAGYDDDFLKRFFSSNHLKGELAGPLGLYLMYDSKNGLLAPLVDAPRIGSKKILWSKYGQSVYLRTYLPLEVSDLAEREARRRTLYDVEIKLPSLEVRKAKDAERPQEIRDEVPVDVKLEEDINTAPKIYVSNSKTQRKALLLDLNPQFNELDFGRVETVEWTVDGISIIGGLYLPPDYQAGRRYPLVIQTHGFDAHRFSMDGIPEWGSAYAARPLAAKGFVVLQAQDFKTRQDHDRIGNDLKIGSTKSQAFRNFLAASYEGVVDYLDGRGLIDRNRVGIVGFSRTVSVVAYTLTHSKFHFTAACLVDGIDGGYFQELAFPYIAWDNDQLNGGVPPFGVGLAAWLRESPSFSLDKVDIPVRLVALGTGSVLEGWEWYAGLSLQKKPVEFVLFPDAVHLVVKPWERMAAQQGLVDWFRFWLKGEEDPDPPKAEQYARWRGLRKLLNGEAGSR
jgi:dipeptidyl aminopeptidase/acylaminoacyl peptidase